MIMMSEEFDYVKRFLRIALVPYHPNPGWSVTAVLTISGFLLFGFCAVMGQLGYGQPDPTVIEIGRFAFYTGIGRASVLAQSNKKPS